MTVYAFFMTLIVGIFIGFVAAVYLAIKMEEHKRRQAMKAFDVYVTETKQTFHDSFN